MVDAPALGAGGAIHGGSSPLLGTIKKLKQPLTRESADYSVF